MHLVLSSQYSRKEQVESRCTAAMRHNTYSPAINLEKATPFDVKGRLKMFLVLLIS